MSLSRAIKRRQFKMELKEYNKVHGTNISMKDLSRQIRKWNQSKEKEEANNV